MRVNLAIAPIPQLDSVSGGIKDRQEAYYGLLSSQVGSAGQISNLFLRDLKELGELVRYNGGLSGLGINAESN